MQHNSSSKFTNPVIDNLEKKHARGRKRVESQVQHFRQSQIPATTSFPDAVAAKNTR